MSYFDEWVETCFSEEDEGKIRSIGCWSYGSSRKKPKEEIQSSLAELGVAEDVISDFIAGVYRVTKEQEEKMTLWEEYNVDVKSDPFDYTVCGLCGNHGIIRMSGLRTPKGDYVPPVVQPCICPNGRAHKRINQNAD